MLIDIIAVDLDRNTAAIADRVARFWAAAISAAVVLCSRPRDGAGRDRIEPSRFSLF